MEKYLRRSLGLEAAENPAFASNSLNAMSQNAQTID
jgi:hypothetical protein